jgi:hypothetical protein
MSQGRDNDFLDTICENARWMDQAHTFGLVPCSERGGFGAHRLSFAGQDARRRALRRNAILNAYVRIRFLVAIAHAPGGEYETSTKPSPLRAVAAIGAGGFFLDVFENFRARERRQLG